MNQANTEKLRVPCKVKGKAIGRQKNTGVSFLHDVKGKTPGGIQ